MQYWLVVPAAGNGQRFGGPVPKQYSPLLGRTLIEWALSVFLADSRCQGACIAIAAADRQFARLPAARDARVHTVPGGQQRADSVAAALAALPAGEEDWVMVHDAARPCVTREEIDRLLEAGSTHGGALLALPVADTLKSMQPGGEVAATVPREGLWRALTPQLFRAGALRAALRNAQASGRVPTDESQAMEWMGEAPLLVTGSAGNLKVTDPSDLALAEAILGGRKEQR